MNKTKETSDQGQSATKDNQYGAKKVWGGHLYGWIDQKDQNPLNKTSAVPKQEPDSMNKDASNIPNNVLAQNKK